MSELEKDVQEQNTAEEGAVETVTGEVEGAQEDGKIEEGSLMEIWYQRAYNAFADAGANETQKRELKAKSDRFWNLHKKLEVGVYKQILANPDEPITGTMEELAKKFDVDLLHLTGILDAMDTAQKNPNPLAKLYPDTTVTIDLDYEKIYSIMVLSKAPQLYKLPEWNGILSNDTRREIYEKETGATVVRREGKKIGRNDPCPCGSGKKYKNCCGRNA